MSLPMYQLDWMSYHKLLPKFKFKAYLFLTIPKGDDVQRKKGGQVIAALLFSR